MMLRKMKKYIAVLLCTALVFNTADGSIIVNASEVITGETTEEETVVEEEKAEEEAEQVDDTEDDDNQVNDQDEADQEETTEEATTKEETTEEVTTEEATTEEATTKEETTEENQTGDAVENTEKTLEDKQAELLDRFPDKYSKEEREEFEKLLSDLEEDEIDEYLEMSDEDWQDLLNDLFEENEVMLLEDEGFTINLIGTVEWTADEAWKDFRVNTNAITLELYKVADGKLNKVDYEINQFQWLESDGDNSYKYKFTQLSPAKYVVKQTAVTAYTVSYGEEEYATGEADMLGENYIMSPIVNTLDTETKVITNHYFGDSAQTVTYTVKIKDKEKTYNAEYDDNGTKKSASGGAVSVELKDATSKTTLTVPKGYDIEITDVASDQCFRISEEEDKTLDYSFVKKTEEKVTKKWNDTLSDTRPAVTFTTKATVEGKDEFEVTDYSALGFQGSDNTPVVSNPGTDHTSTETYTISNLPSYWKDGDSWKKVSYDFEENKVPGYKSEKTVNGGIITFTNTKITDFKASIAWKDNSNSEEVRPDDVTLQLYRYTTEKSKAEEITVNEEDLVWVKTGNTWTVTYKDLDAYNTSSYPYTYYVKQNPVTTTETEIKYGTPKYQNIGEHSQETDCCFNGGIITNTKEITLDEIEFSYAWKGSADNRPEGNIYLWRYTEGSDPKTAAIVTDTNKKIVKKSLNKTKDEEISFTNLPKYDEEGKKYIYITKAVLEGDTDFIYIYPNEKEYADEKEIIILMPQVMENKTFTMTWNTIAYPTVPQGCVAHVHLEKKNKNDEDGSWSSVTTDEDITFSGFTRELFEKDITLSLPKYDTTSGNEGNELDYRVVLDYVDKNGRADVSTDTDGNRIFTVDDQTYKTENNGANIVNSLYDMITYTVKKTWNPNPTDMASASATMQLKDGNNVLEELELNNGSWEKSFTAVNRYDDNGYERDLKVKESSFTPNTNNEKKYSTDYIYTRTDSRNMLVTVNNFIPGDTRHIGITKEWIDGGDYQSHRPVTVDVYENGSDTVYKTVILNEGNNWYTTIEVNKDTSYSYTIKEKSVNDGEDKEVNYNGTDKGIVITSQHRYEVTVNGTKVTNKVTGKVEPKVEIKWQDGGVATDRPEIIATLQKFEDGKWVDTENKITLTQDNATTTGSRTDNTWSESFPVQEKYDDKGNMLSYRIKIKYTSEKYNQTDQSSSYTSNETKDTYEEAKYTDKLVNEITLTKTGKKNIEIHKIWKDDGTQKRPDITLKLYRKVKDAEGSPAEYTATKTDYGYVERVWSYTDNYNYTCEIRNLEATDENGNPYEYYIEEVLNNPGDYKGYYFAPEANTSDMTKALETNYAPEKGYIVNRLEGEVEIIGSKIWNNLEPGMTAADLPSPVIYVQRKIGDVEDSVFNDAKQYKVTLDKENGKYGFKFGNKYQTDLPALERYNENGKQYHYYLGEDFTSLSNNPYNSYATTTNDYSLVNEYLTGAINTRKIVVNKKWNSAFAVGNAKYPTITFKLLRYESTSDTTTSDTNPVEIIKTITVDSTVGTETTSGTVTFDDLRIISPKGNTYIYKVKEIVKNGYVESVTGDVKGSMATESDGVVVTIEDVPYKKNSTEDLRTKTVSFSNQYVGSETSTVNPAVTLTGNKKWYEETGETELRPDNLVINVYRYSTGDKATDDEDITTKCNITWEKSGNTWTYTIKPKDDKTLLTYAPNGTEYQYKVIEAEVPNYKNYQSETVLNKSKSGNTITMNDLENYLVGSLEVTKEWVDGSDQYGLRPKSVTVQLERKLEGEDDNRYSPVMKDSKAITAVLDKSNNWIYTFKSLAPKEKNSGKNYVYRAKEIKMDETAITSITNKAYTTTYKFPDGKQTIINTVNSTSLKVVKKWEGDQNDLYGTRPKDTSGNWSISVDLQYKNDGDIADTTGWRRFATKTITGTQNSAEIEFTDLPKCSLDGKVYLYRAVETGGGPANYTDFSQHEKTENGYQTTLTNTLIISSTNPSVSVSKKWYAASGTTKKEVEVELLQSVNGSKPASCNPQKKLILKGDSWQGTWENVPERNSKGLNITYSVKELTELKNFAVSYQTDASNSRNFIITNTELMDYQLTLEWNNNENGLTQNANFVLQRKLKDELGDYADVSKVFADDGKTEKQLSGNTTYTWTDLPKYDETGKEYVYRVVETYVGETNKGAALGTFGATYTDHKTDTTSEITYGYSTPYKTYQITSTACKYIETNATTGKELYGNTITNEPVLVSKTGTKTWSFKDLNSALKDDTTKTYQESIIPSSIDLELQWKTSSVGTFAEYKSTDVTVGKQELSKTITIPDDKTSNWTYKYSNLPKYSLDGKTEIEYQVVETAPQVVVSTSPETKEAVFKATTTSTSGTATKDEPKLLNNYTNAPVLTTISGKKVWDDNENANGLRPSELTLTVYENNVEMSPQPAITWTKENTEWTYEIAGLPKFVQNADGYRKAVYSVKETEPSFYQNISTSTNKDAIIDSTDATGKKLTTLTNKVTVIAIENTTKVVSDSSTILKGATFKITGELKDKDSNRISEKEITLTEGNLVLTPANLGGYGLQPGVEYTVTQNTAVDGYQTIVGTIKFKINESGKLVIPTDGNGKIADAPEETRYSDAGIVRDATSTSVAVLQIQNVKTNASVKILKYDKNAIDKKLKGVKFKFYKQIGDNPKIEEGVYKDTQMSIAGNSVFTTDENGEITISGLEEGKYYFIETATLADYKALTDPIPFEVTNRNHNQTIEVKVPNVSLNSYLRIYKYDKEGIPIKDVKFTVNVTPAGELTSKTFTLETDAEGKAICTTTDADWVKDGQLKILKGTYEIKETSVPTGYQINAKNSSNADQPLSCSFTIDEGVEIPYIFISESWLKKVEDGQTLSNAARIHFTMDAGLKKAFLSAEKDDAFNLTAKGGAVYNERIPGSVTLKKVDGDDTDKALNDVEFKLEKKKEGTIWENIRNFITGNTYQDVLYDAKEDAAGVLTIKNLSWGEYRITEITPKDGYFLFATNPTIEFKVWGGKDGVIDHALQYNGTDIKNYKTQIHIGVEETCNQYSSASDSSNYETSKAGIELSLTGLFAGGTQVETISWTSGDSTKTFVGNLIVGKEYILAETKRPDGYEAWTSPVVIKVNKNGEIVIVDGNNETLSDGQPNGQITKGNMKDGTAKDKTTLFVRNVKIKGAVELKKTGYQNKVLEGVTFKLYKEDGTEITVSPEIKTDADGIWSSVNADNTYKVELPEGKYYFMETSTPDGYREQADKKYPFEITANNQYASKGVVNCPIVNSLLLNLVDVNTSNNKLDDFKFTITGNMKNPTSPSDSSTEQTIEITKDNLEDINKLLVPGESYTMVQTGINNGYYLNSGIDFTLKSDGSITLIGNTEYRVDETTGDIIVTNRPIPEPESEKGGSSGGSSSAVVTPTVDETTITTPTEMTPEEIAETLVSELNSLDNPTELTEEVVNLIIQTADPALLPWDSPNMSEEIIAAWKKSHEHDTEALELMKMYEDLWRKSRHGYQDSDVPETGDQNRPYLWLLAAIVSGVGYLLLGKKKKNSQANKEK